MKLSQAVRILNARKYAGHRCWCFQVTGRGSGMVETRRGCGCRPDYWQLDGIESIAGARLLLGEITREQFNLMYLDSAKRPEPESVLTEPG